LRQPDEGGHSTAIAITPIGIEALGVGKRAFVTGTYFANSQLCQTTPRYRLQIDMPAVSTSRRNRNFTARLEIQQGSDDFGTDFKSRLTDTGTQPGHDLPRLDTELRHCGFNNASYHSAPPRVSDPDSRAIPVAQQNGQAIGREYCTHGVYTPAYGPIGLDGLIHRAACFYYVATVYLFQPDRL